MDPQNQEKTKICWKIIKWDILKIGFWRPIKPPAVKTQKNDEICQKMTKNAKSEPRDPQKPKIYEKTIALDPTRPRESTKKVCFDPVKVGRTYSIIYNIINCIIYYMKYNRKRNRYSKIIYNHTENMQTIPKQQIWGGGREAPAPPKRRRRRRFCCFGMVCIFPIWLYMILEYLFCFLLQLI